MINAKYLVKTTVAVAAIGIVIAHGCQNNTEVSYGQQQNYHQLRLKDELRHCKSLLKVSHRVQDNVQAVRDYHTIVLDSTKGTELYNTFQSAFNNVKKHEENLVQCILDTTGESLDLSETIQKTLP